jgi:hypothetical protein
MSGSNSSAPDAAAPREGNDGPLNLTVHGLPPPALERQTRSGRMRMFFVLLICAAPVVLSYFTYFVIRPEGRTNYSELIDPQRPVPDTLPLTDLQGRAVVPKSLKGQWLLVVVAGSACDKRCEEQLYLQRQLRETLGREKDRLDKLWLIPDEGTPRSEVMQAVSPKGAEATVLRVPRDALAAWLAPAAGRQLEDHLYIVDPMGHWMMRTPLEHDEKEHAKKLKRDLDKLMRGSSSWDQAGR